MQLFGDRCLVHELIFGLYPRMNMNYNPEKHHRRSIRLKGYDYTREGAYYFTICCHQRRCLLGEIKDGFIHLNLVGATVKAVWDSLPRHFPLIELDAFVVMPNHVHGIILITDSTGNRNRNPNSNPNLNCRGEAFVLGCNNTPRQFPSTNASPFPGCNLEGLGLIVFPQTGRSIRVQKSR